jgi:hypothetical protein
VCNNIKAIEKEKALHLPQNKYLAREWNKKYANILLKVINNPRRTMAAFGMVLVFIFVLNKIVPTSFIPKKTKVILP